MKKIISFLFIIFILTGCSNNKNNKVNLYLFYSSTCPHCHKEIEWLDTINNNYKNLNIVKYEASENMDFYEQVIDKMNINDYHVPLTIIGSDCTIGFSDDIKEEIEGYIKEYSSKSACDVVDSIKNNKNIESCINKNNKK